MTTLPKKRSRHGLTALRAAVKCNGLEAVDNRTRAARSLMQWRAQLLADLGGEENLSAQRMALVEAVTRTRLFVDHVDAFLLSQSSLVSRKRKSVLPVLRERQSLVDLMARLLGQLGLNRVAKDSGAIPESWITKVQPVQDQDVQQQVQERVQHADVPELSQDQIGKDDGQ
jgi:hypothetical protein